MTCNSITCTFKVREKNTEIAAQFLFECGKVVGFRILSSLQDILKNLTGNQLYVFPSLPACVICD